ncbi:MAG: GAF domain-containing protein [Spirochaetes bacterium]|nr:GAF domain-containing protein [Spirochaetota bacterium]
MRNKLINKSLSYGTDLFIVLAAFVISLPFLNSEMIDHRFIFFFFIFWLALLPLINYFRDIIDSYISPIYYEDIFSKTVDAVLNMKSLDEILKETFVQILTLIKVRNGLLIFYYPDRDEYRIFYQKNMRRKVIRNARIENNNAIFLALKSPDDILIKNKLSPANEFEFRLIKEMEKLHAETIVPIFFRDTFLGAIVTGKRNRKFSNRELALLKTFAAKIAMLSINNYFLNELMKKKEIEKEYELASTIHSRFLPEHDLQIGPIEVKIHYKAKSLSTREFFDAFEDKNESGCMHFSAYSIRGDIAGTAIHMPGIQAYLHAVRMVKKTPKAVVTKLIKSMSKREILDEEPAIIAGTIYSNGLTRYFSHKYPSPFVFRHNAKKLFRLPEQREKETSFLLKKGDVLIICSANIHHAIAKDLTRFSSLIAEYEELSLVKLRSAMAKSLPRAEEGDTLLFIARFGAIQ